MRGERPRESLLRFGQRGGRFVVLVACGGGCRALDVSVDAAFLLGLMAAARRDMNAGARMGASFLWILASLAALAVLSASASLAWRKARLGLFAGLLAAGLVYPLGATLGRTGICSGWRN